MSHTTIDPVDAMKPEGRLGLVFEDQRTNELRQVLYADSQVVLVRDETDNTTLQNREAFERSLGSRYQVCPDADPRLDGGPFDRLRDALETYEREDGRTAAHKAEALRETFDIFAVAESPSAEATGTATADATADESQSKVSFEDVDGIGPKTAGALRTHGFVTEADVRGATDDELLGVPGLGPESLENLRGFVG